MVSCAIDEANGAGGGTSRPWVGRKNLQSLVFGDGNVVWPVEQVD